LFIQEASMNENPQPHSVRRIVLPSGRSIEVIRFAETEKPPAGLHVCVECGSDLVQPNAWGQVTADHWELELHCPNCGHTREGVFDQEDVAALEERLDEGVEAILRDLQRLTHANMSDQIDRFAAALEADLILPEDF
jgi:DNA-directed RNA polymerase subunit RPC12/RpoP